MNIKNIIAAVEATNRLNAAIIAELNHVLPQLQQYVGKKISTQTGKAAIFKYTHLLKDHGPQYARIEIGSSSLWLNVSIHSATCPQIKNQVWIGKISDHILTQLATVEEVIKTYQLDTDITADKCIAMMNEYANATAVIESINRNFPISKDFLKYL